MLLNGGSGATTILGNVAGSSTLVGGIGSIIDVSYGNLVFTGGAGADTIAGFGGSMTVQGGAGRTGGRPACMSVAPPPQRHHRRQRTGDHLWPRRRRRAHRVGQRGRRHRGRAGVGSTGANNFYAGPGANLILAGAGAVTMVSPTHF